MKSQALINAVLIKRAWNTWDTVDLATDFIPGVGLVKNVGKGLWNASQGNWGQAAGNLVEGAVTSLPFGGALKGMHTAYKATKGLGAGLRAGANVAAKGVTNLGTRAGAKALGSAVIKPLTTAGGAAIAGAGTAGGLAAQNQSNNQVAGEEEYDRRIQEINADRAAQGMPSVQQVNAPAPGTAVAQPAKWYNPMTWGAQQPATTQQPAPPLKWTQSNV